MRIGICALMVVDEHTTSKKIETFFQFSATDTIMFSSKHKSINKMKVCIQIVSQEKPTRYLIFYNIIKKLLFYEFNLTLAYLTILANIYYATFYQLLNFILAKPSKPQAISCDILSKQLLKSLTLAQEIIDYTRRKLANTFFHMFTKSRSTKIASSTLN